MQHQQAQIPMLEEPRQPPSAPHPVPLRPAMAPMLVPREAPLALPVM
jgi:hypothetical protein